MVYIAITGGRRETLYCAIVRAVTVWGGVPKQRVGAQRIVLIRAQRPRHKTISRISQALARKKQHGRATEGHFAMYTLIYANMYYISG